MLKSKELSEKIIAADFANVNVKAKTNEGIGAVGAGLAIEATVIVLLRRRLK